jgi:hypothetical protein
MATEDIIQLWDTWEFTALLTDDRYVRPDGFWLQFFPTPFFSEKEEIFFDELPIEDRRMAPFVMPHLQGRIMRAPQGAGLRSFRPAYLKPKHEVSPSMAVPRMPGEPLGGNLSRQERFNRIVADRAIRQDAMIRRRWDWMAAQAAIYGYCDVAGEDYTPVRIDFRRDADLTEVLTGTARWGQADANPLKDVADMRGRGLKKGRSPINRIVMGSGAAANFLAFPGLKELTDLRYRQSGTATFNTSGFRSGEPVEAIGTFVLPDGGTVEFFKYENSYEDPVDGVEKPLLHENDVVGVGTGLNGIRAFGAIEDIKAGMQATDVFTKNYEKDDPSKAFVVSQSAPLMVPGNPDNSFRLRTA